MSIKLAIIVMDPITQINIKKDTSFAMLLAAQGRGYELTYLEMNDLYLDTGKPMCNARSLSVQRDPENWFALGEPEQLSLCAFDVILMRKDPPFDSEYLYATQMLELAERLAHWWLIVLRPFATLMKSCSRPVSLT